MSATLRNFWKVGEFDPTACLEDLAALPMWNWLNVRRMFPGSEHLPVDDIVMRFAPLVGAKSVADVFEGLVNVSYFPWYAMGNTRTLVETHQPEDAQGIGRVVVALLRGRRFIKPHRDEGGYAQAHRRIHFALTSSPECLFHCGDETISMAPGEIWEFDHHEVHSVVNDSDESRIHIIADYLR